MKGTEHNQNTRFNTETHENNNGRMSNDRKRLCQVNQIQYEISVNRRWLLYAISIA